MTLVVEDGTGKALANAYIDVTFADAYFAARGVGEWLSLTQEAKEAAIVAATDYIDARWGPRLIGRKQFPQQALQFPRYGVPCAPAGTIPQALQKACAEYAIRASKGPLAPDPTIDQSGQVVTGRKSKVGPIETDLKFQASAVAGGYAGLLWRPYPSADSLMSCMVWSGSKVIRD